MPCACGMRLKISMNSALSTAPSRPGFALAGPFVSRRADARLGDDNVDADWEGPAIATTSTTNIVRPQPQRAFIKSGQRASGAGPVSAEYA